MAILPKRSNRTGRQAAQPTPPPSPARRLAGPRPANYELIECIVGLQIRQAPLDMLARESLLPILAAFGARAGGILLHHRDDGSLRLTASSGLSLAGQRHLECLKRGGAGGWEIPLHGLLNRKAYIIERPHEHPFVPELVERDETNAVPNLASIPLYRGTVPVGVLLVIADQQPLTDAEIMAHVLVYDVLSLALETGMRQRGDTLVPLAEAVEPGFSCDAWNDPREVASALEIELASVSEERDALAQRIGELESRYVAAVEQLDTRGHEHLDTLDSERAAAARRIADVEAAAAEETARLRDRIEEDRRSLLAAAEEERQRLTATAEAERDRLMAAAEAERDRLTAAAEAERDRLTAEAEARLVEARASAAAVLARREAELGERVAALDATVALLESALRERDELLRQRDDVLRERDDALAKRLAELQDVSGERDRTRQAAVEAGDVVRRLHAEIERLTSALEAAEAARVREVTETRAALEGEMAETRNRLERELVETRTRLESAVTDTRTTLEHQQAEMRTLHERELARAEAAGAVALERATTAEQQVETLEGDVAALRTDVARQEAMRAQVLGALGDPGADPVAAIDALHRQIEGLTGQLRALDDARDALARSADEAARASEQRLADARAEAQRRLEQERAEAQQRIEQLRDEAQQRLDAARAAQSEMQARATSAEARATTLEAELADVRSEVARLSEERAHVLAAVDEPGAEPATVIRALREQVATLDGQLAMHAAERAALERRLAAEAQAHEARIADLAAAAETRIAEVRSAVQASLDETRSAAAATLDELRGVLAEREATLMERDRVLADMGADRDRSRQAALDAGDANRRQQSELDRARAELEAAQAALGETRARAMDLERRTATLDHDLEQARGEVERLREERARVVAAVDDADAEPAAVIRALREQVEALGGEVRALASEHAALERRAADERAALERQAAADRAALEQRAVAERLALEQRATSERAALEQRLAAVEQAHAEAERLRADHEARASALGDDLVRSEEMLSAARQELEDALSRATAAASAVLDELTPPAASAAATRPGGTRTSADPAKVTTPPTIEVLAPPPAPVVSVGVHEVLEADPARRERVAAECGAALAAAPDGRLFIANLLTAVPDRIADLEEAADRGAQLVAYAADGSGRSRILGAMCCFAGVPDPAELVAALDGKVRSFRRVVALADDLDALLPAKTSLTKAGHSVSIACDTKQGLDLVGIVSPDVVVIDLHNAPASVAEMLDALPLESGHVLTVLVHADEARATLRQVLERLLRPGALELQDLARTCTAVLTGPPARTAPPSKPLRVVERAGRAPARKAPVAARIIVKRR